MIRALRSYRQLFVILTLAAPLVAQTQQGALHLTLQEAIQRGLKANLGVLVAETRVAESTGTAERRQSLLLPHVRIDAAIAEQTRSLAAMGITLPGAPAVAGPLSTYETRAYADQSIVDMQALHGLRSARLATAATKSDYQDARDQVVRGIAGLYLAAQSAAAQEAAAQSSVEKAQALYKLAADQRDAGVANGIDVLRAQVQLANERQALVQARNSVKSALLVLARSLGMPPGTPIELANKLEFRQTQTVDVESALTAALNARADYQSMAKQREALGEQLRASRARFLPKFFASGNYGAIGQTVPSMRGTGLIQGTLSFTVFDRDREGEAKEIEARIQRIDRQINDVRLGIEQELRQALLNIDSAAEEVAVSAAGLDLAEKELDLAKLRFSEGVTNNIEVVNAQDSYSRAQRNSIVALTQHSDARIELARALGNIEASYADSFGDR